MFTTRRNAIWNLESMVLAFMDLVVEDTTLTRKKVEPMYLNTETILRSLI